MKHLVIVLFTVAALVLSSVPAKAQSPCTNCHPRPRVPCTNCHPYPGPYQPVLVPHRPR